MRVQGAPRALPASAAWPLILPEHQGSWAESPSPALAARAWGAGSRAGGAGGLTPPPPGPDHFQHLLNESERALQDAFPSAFGELYAQSAKAFRDLYAELRLYYRGADLHLEETLAEFWARLLERLFRQLRPQLLLPDDYLDCLGKQADALRPFGEAPRELRMRATRAFVAARAFVQGLGVAGDVVRKVAQVRTAARALGSRRPSPPAPPLPCLPPSPLGPRAAWPSP